MKQSTQIRLLHGPYHPPEAGRGQILRCKIRGNLPVSGYSDGLMTCQLEAGRRRRVTEATLARIATALECRVGELT